ncbi:MAG: carbamoyltransferase [Candidatus Scalinduaceae bacterium]
MKILGIFYFPGYPDPSAAVVINGEVIAFIEEERLIRNKHAKAYFPSRSIKSVLNIAGLDLQLIDRITFGWDCISHEDGRLVAHFAEINKEYPPTPNDKAYQHNRVNRYTAANLRRTISQQLKKMYGDVDIPPISFMNHHLSHAIQAYYHSGMNQALILTIDGSGEWVTTAWWQGDNGNKLTLLHEVKTPHSLGWFYSAFTEYLGFEAYDGEYKVMGLAAYGKENSDFVHKINKITWYDEKGGFLCDPYIIAMGPRTYSDHFPDLLIEHIGHLPRCENERIEQWHMDLAYCVQYRLENIVYEMARYWIEKTRIRNLCIAGGVGLNVKMNGNLIKSGLIDDIFIHPLCSDTGMSIASALACEYQNGNLQTKQLEHVYYGPSFEDGEIENILKACKLIYTYEENIEKNVAQLLSAGNVVGWFQGKMEAGPRALGNRSILADPRTIESRDRVNAVIKFREFWRPFCPSMTKKGANKYLDKYTHAPFMIITFDAKEAGKKDIPAVVHVDGTSRIQIVIEEHNPRYYKLLEEFETITGIPVVMNTSFNIKGEPIVCTPHDAIRTFFATGLDALAIGSFLLQKTG